MGGIGDVRRFCSFLDICVLTPIWFCLTHSSSAAVSTGQTLRLDRKFHTAPSPHTSPPLSTSTPVACFTPPPPTINPWPVLKWKLNFHCFYALLKGTITQASHKPASLRSSHTRSVESSGNHTAACKASEQNPGLGHASNWKRLMISNKRYHVGWKDL